MTDLKLIVAALAALVSTVYNVLHGQLSALFGLFTPIAQLSVVSFPSLYQDLTALQPADRLLLEQQFDAALTITDAATLKKVQDSASALDDAVDLAEDAVALYLRGVALVAKVKVILGTMSPAAGVRGLVGAPAWLPSWFPSWLWSGFTGVLVNIALPALATAFPAEAPLLMELIQFLKSGVLGVRLSYLWANRHQAQRLALAPPGGA